jgi:hypothetical protein
MTYFEGSINHIRLFRENTGGSLCEYESRLSLRDDTSTDGTYLPHHHDQGRLATGADSAGDLE